MKKYSLLFTLSLSLAIVISCNQQAALTTSTVIARGDSLSKATFDTLRHALMTTIASKGLPAAVSYCNEQALPITNYYASAGISIQRVAAKYRNANNQLDSLDKIQWNKYEQLKASGDTLSPAVVELNDAFVYYKPIMLQPMCTSCHGEKNTAIPPMLQATIDSLYPQDKAVGFAAGDLRGMWKIRFSK
jgi:hypothetical protein